MTLRPTIVLATTALAAAAVAAAAPAAPPAPAPIVSFTGLDSNQNPGVNPADVQVAVGPGSVVELVNTAEAVWDTSGGTPVLSRSQQLGALFSDGSVNRSGDAMTDPRVLFDVPTQRFFAAAFDITRRETDLAVSASSDPRGAWRVIALPSSGCPDQPRLGVSTNVVTLTDDLFSSCRGRGFFLGGEVIVLSKDDVLSGAAPRESRFGPNNQFAAITPAQSLAGAAVEYLASVSESGATVGIAHVDDATVASLPQSSLQLSSPISKPPTVPQRGSGVALDTGDNRAQNAFWDDGRLWLTATEACPTDRSRSCARVLEIDPTVPRVVVDRTIDLGGRSVLYPAAAPDSLGNVVVAFEYSSSADYPSLAYTYIRPDGGVGAPADVTRGSAPNDSGRYGDYSGAARDVSDPARVWFAGEVGAAVDGTLFGWTTGVGSARVPPQPPAVRSATAPGQFAAELFPEGSPTTYRFEYGLTTAYGATTAAVPVGAGRSTTVTRPPPALLAGRTYHYRVVATNANGTSTGPDETLTVPAAAPLVRYASPTAARAGAAVTLRAVVTPRGAATSVYFDYGTSQTYGRRTAVRRVTGATPATVSMRVAGLARGRVYHFRVVATNARGQTVGADRVVRT